MTDQEIVHKILDDCIVCLEYKDITGIIKNDTYNKLRIISNRKQTLEITQISRATGFYLEKSSSQLTFSSTAQYLLDKLKGYKTANKHLNVILLFPKDIEYLYNFYKANISTKESLEDLMNNINIEHRTKNKIEILEKLYNELYGEENPF